MDVNVLRVEENWFELVLTLSKPGICKLFREVSGSNPKLLDNLGSFKTIPASLHVTGTSPIHVLHLYLR